MGSTGSQARLIQSSHAPSNYQPVLMKDLGKQTDTDISKNTKSEETTETENTANAKDTTELDEKAATVAASFNLSIGSSGSLFTTNSCADKTKTDESNAQNSNQSLGIMQKRLSPRQSPKQDIEVIEIFAHELCQLSAAEQVAVVRSKDASKRSSSSSRRTSGDEPLAFMDKQLSDLEHEQLAEATCDIAAYMANLKEQSLEIQDIDMEAEEALQNDSSLSPEPQTIVENTQHIVVVADIESPPRLMHESDSTTSTTGTSEKSGDDSETDVGTDAALLLHPVVIDKKVDKVFKSKSNEKASKSSSTSGAESSSSSTSNSNAKPKSSALRSPRQSIYISPDRAKTQISSPIKIIKIKSPRESVSEQGGKNLSVSSSRESSQDRLSSGRRSPSPRRSSEGGGILKRCSSPSLTGTGILKVPSSAAGSPTKSKSPDRSCLKATPQHDCSIESTLSQHLSPLHSFDNISPDRAGSLCLKHSPRNSFDARSAAECNLELPKSYIKSPRGSFDSRSPDRNVRKPRSASAHGSFDITAPEKTEAYYQYYPIYDNQTCSDHYVCVAPHTSTSGHRKRQSKSVERYMSRDSSVASGSTYRYGVSPERLYNVNQEWETTGPIRSQSAENAFSSRSTANPYDNYYYQQPSAKALYYEDASCAHERTAYKLSSSAPEHTSCFDCLYQQRASQLQQQQFQHKSRSRQSRSRKKTPRSGVIPNYEYEAANAAAPQTVASDVSGCVDCNDYYEIHV